MKHLLILTVLMIILLLLAVFYSKGCENLRNRISQQISSLQSSDITEDSPDEKSKLSESDRAIVSEDVQRSCETIITLLVDVPGVKIKQSEGVIHDHYQNRKGYGCKITVSGSTTAFHDGKNPDTVVREKLSAAGWQEVFQYCADGPDGTAFAFRTSTVLCLCQASWDGGDCSDSTYVPDDHYELSISCVSTQGDSSNSGTSK